MASLPALSEDQWLLLSVLSEPEFADGAESHALKGVLGWHARRVREVSSAESLNPFLGRQTVDSRLRLSITPVGRRAVEDRRALLDPQTLSDRLSAISMALEGVLKSGLNRKAVIALVHDRTKLSKKSIGQVLDSLQEIKDVYCSGKK